MNLKKQVFNAIFEHCVDNNGSKILDDGNSRNAFYYFRNRSFDCAYYKIRIRGNHITATKIQWLVNNQPINTFASCSVPAFINSAGGSLEVPEPVRKHEILVKKNIRDLQGFIKEFKQKTPDLNWFEA